MANLVADLKFFLSGGGDSVILKHDFHKGDDSLVGFAIMNRGEIGEIIEFFTNNDEDLFDEDFFEYDYDPIVQSDILAALSIHSTLKRDVDDMQRIFGCMLGDCYWLDAISNWVSDNQVKVGKQSSSLTLTPKLLEDFDPRFFPFATVEALKIIAEEQSVFDPFSGLRELPEESARLIVGDEDLDLSGLTSISDADAKSLSEHKGDLYLDRLTELPATVATSLSKHQGYLGLSGLTTLSDAAAESLSKHKGGLSLDGLTSLSDAAAESLSEYQGNLGLSGLTSLSDAAAESLSKHQGDFEQHSLSETSDAVAELNEDKIDDDCNEVRQLTAKVARKLVKQKDQSNTHWALKEFESISEDAAEVLVRYKGDLLSLDALQEISPVAASSLAKYKGDLYLRGLKRISDETAEALSRHEGPLLDLYNLEALSDEAAHSLAKYKGDDLVLVSLKNLSSKAANSLENCEAKIHRH